MQKNWYIIYTKPKCAKKVATIFTKRKIENFFPVNCKKINTLKRRKIHEEPLFDSYVFAYIPESQITKIKMIDGVLNLVYWKGKPATICDNEIEIMKEFITDYQNIKVENAIGKM